MAPSKQRKKRRSKTEKQTKKLLFSEAINYLLQRSLDLRSTDPSLAKEYYQAAKKMGMRGRFHLPKPYRQLFCHNCLSPITSDTTRVRLNSKKKQVHYQCLLCQSEHRFGYHK
ncbi:MAG: ribonuclease P Rpr2/Rpp21/SNM1 subunit [Candidatus Hodarchaeales archaeon]